MRPDWLFPPFTDERCGWVFVFHIYIQYICGRDKICEGSRTGTAKCLNSVGVCASENFEMALNLDGANAVAFPVAGSV